MPGVVEAILILLQLCQSVLGFLGDGFIGLVNCVDCAKNQKCSMVAFILIGLAMSRICLLWFITLDGFIKVFFPDIYDSDILIECMGYLWIISSNLSTWFATSLSTFYFLKIANFSHQLFLWLKRRINRIFPFLMGCVFVSCLIIFPLVIKGISNYKINSTNTSWQFRVRTSESELNLIFLNVLVLVPFAVSLITCLLLIISLWRHKRQMQLNAVGVRDLNTEAHVKAMKMLASFLILFTLHFIGIAIELAYVFIPENKLMFIFGWTITTVYPWGHSFILILGNSRLKQAGRRVLSQLKCSKKSRNLRAA